MTETDKPSTAVEGVSKDNASNSDGDTTVNGKPQPEYPPHLVALKTSLKSLWNSRKGSPTRFNAELVGIFSKYTNPLTEFAEFLEVIVDAGFNGSFSHYITKQFGIWLNKPDTEKPDGGFFADKTTQLRALTASSRANSKDIKELIFNTYKLIESPELLFILSNQLKEKKSFLPLCHWICLYKMEDKFELKDYLFPILLSRNFFEVFSFLAQHPDSVSDVIKYADSIFYSIQDLTQQFVDYNLTTPKKNVLTNVQRNIENVMRKIIKKFNVSQDLTPNFNKKMIELEIKFYINNFSRFDMSEEGFKERVEALCCDNAERQLFLVETLLKKKGAEYLAEYYCNKYNISDIEIPKEIQRVELTQEFHKVDNLSKMVTFVDSAKTANVMLKYIDSLVANDPVPEEGKEETPLPGIPVGLDTEWKSICNVNVTRPPALLQVAFENKIFIVDITVLHASIDFWKQLNEKLFTNNRFIKLGYGLNEDQCKFDYYSDLSFIKLGGAGSLDLLREERKYGGKKSQVTFPHEVNTDDSDTSTRSWRGISRLVALCFSKPLDKREQLSDWEKRPLRQAQIQYAALDAFCLIQVYNVLKEMHSQSNQNFSIRGDGVQTTSNNKGRYRRWGRPQPRYYNRNRRNFRNNYRKKVEVSTQSNVDSTEVFTQTDKVKGNN